VTDDTTREILHRVRREHIDFFDWDKAADTIAKTVNAGARMARKATLSEILQASVKPLLEGGLAVLPMSLQCRECDDVRAYLGDKLGWPGHHMRSVLHGQKFRPGDRYQCYDPETVLRAPHLLGFALEPAIVDMIEMALGCVPTLYSVNLWWSYPAEGEPWPPHSQTFHRDDDDFRFFTLFVYLTDVPDLKHGPNQIVAGTHRWDVTSSMAHKAHADDVRAGTKAAIDLAGRFPKGPVPDEHIVSTLGPAGTAFVADTRALHRGLPPIAAPRLMFWARYGLGPNSNSSDIDLPTGPIPRRQIPSPIASNHRNRYVARMLVNWD